MLGFFVAVQLLRRKVYVKKIKTLYTKIVNILKCNGTPSSARARHVAQGDRPAEDCVSRASIVTEGEEEENNIY